MAFTKHLVYVSTKLGLAFFSIGKNASTTIRCINELELDLNFGQVIRLELFTELLEQNSYFKFAVLRRDVVSRFVSAYIQDEKQGGFYGKSSQSLDMPKDIDTFEAYLSIAEKAIETQYETQYTSHMSKQIDYLKDGDGNLMDIDFYIRMDRMNEDINLMMDKIGQPRFEFNTEENVTEEDDKNIVIKSITEEQRNRILKLYEDDINLYDNV